MEGPYKLLPAEQAKLPNWAYSASRSLYGPSMSYLLGFQTKYIWNPWGIPVHPAQLVLLYLSTLLDSWLAHCVLNTYFIYYRRSSLLTVFGFCGSAPCGRSAIIRDLIKLKSTEKPTAQGERVCLKDSKYILFEDLENQTCKYKLLPAEPAKSANWAC